MSNYIPYHELRKTRIVCNPEEAMKELLSFYRFFIEWEYAKNLKKEIGYY